MMPRPRPLSTRRRSQGGFTLAEMMAVIGLSSFSLGFIFYMLIQTSRVHGQQEAFYDLHNAARYGTMMLENDLRRIGLHAPLGTGDPRLCNPPANFFGSNTRDSNGFSRGLFSIYFENGSRTPQTGFITNTNNQHIQTDVLEIMGNFATDQDFAAEIRGDNLFLNDIPEGGREGFRRAFFNQGQLLAVRSSLGKIQIVQVNNLATWNLDADIDNAFTSRILPITTGALRLQFNAGCGVTREGTAVRVAPLLRMRYELCSNAVLPPPADATCQPLGVTGDTGRWRLRRTPLFVNCTAIGTCIWAPHPIPLATATNPPAFTPIDLVENVVDLQFWFAQDNPVGGLVGFSPVTTLPGGFSNTINAVPLYDGTSSSTGGSAVNDPVVTRWTGDPLNVRMIHYRIAVRGSNEERSLAHKVRNDPRSPISTFNLRPNGAGNADQASSARVRTLSGGVLLYNFLAR